MILSRNLRTLLLCAGAALAMAGASHAQDTNPAVADKDHMTYGREADIVKDQIKSYNNANNAPIKPTVFKSPGAPFTPIDAAEQVKAMGAGMNIAGGYDAGYWDGKSKIDVLDDDIKRVADAGFKTIRVPLFTFRHIVDTEGNLDPAYLARIDHIVEQGIANHLNVILDEHDFDDCAKDPDACAVLLSNVWYDLALRYQTTPNTVMFELLNEPHGKIDAATWNAWIPDLVATVRQFNPTRNLIIGPVMWNSADQLAALKLPDDKHIIVTFHDYSPMEFTHQGASWAGPDLEKLRNVRWTGTPEEMAKLNATFDTVKAWSQANNRPIFLGEYGTYGKFNSNMGDRVAWTKAMSEAADARGFARAYWYYEDGDGFGVWDKDAKSWRKPLLGTLLPNSPAAK